MSAAGGPGPRERQGAPAAPRSTLVYDEVLQQHRLLLSKLDLEEKRRKEAREGGEPRRSSHACKGLIFAQRCKEVESDCFHSVDIGSFLFSFWSVVFTGREEQF